MYTNKYYCVHNESYFSSIFGDACLRLHQSKINTIIKKYEIIA